MSAAETASATTFGWRARVGYAALSALAAWLASQVVCLPLNLLTAVRDTEGQERLFVETLLDGLLVWAGWTFWLALIGWVVLVLPLVLTIRPCLLVRMRGWMLLGSVLISAAVVETQWRAFRDLSAHTLFQRYALMLPYICFAVTYAVGTAAIYIRLSKRRLDAADQAKQVEAGFAA